MRVSDLVLVLLPVVACDRSSQAVGALQGPRPSALEYSVYSVILLSEGREIVIADSTQPIEMCHPPEPYCWIAAVSTEYKTAAGDYMAKNRSKVIIEDRFPPALSAHLRREWSGERARGCRDTPRLTLSRVGLSDDSTRAVVAYQIVVGEGPYPGCGYMAGAVVVLRRDSQGTWKIEKELSSWIT